MRKLLYAMSVSLDGFIEDRHGGLDWSVPDEELHRHFNELDAMIDVHLYGRGLYEIMAAYWPTADENPSAAQVEIEYSRLWKRMPKVVFSRTLEQVGWNSRLVRENLAEEVNRLKQQPGKYLSVGGAGLAASLMQLGLIDEYWLYIHPVILGGGKPMFGALPDMIHLQLVETRTFGPAQIPNEVRFGMSTAPGSGVVLIRYQRVEESR